MRTPAALVLASSLLAAGCFKLDVNLGGRPEGAPAGASQLPAGAAAGGGSWADLAAAYSGQFLLGAEFGAVFIAFDTLAYPAEPVDLAARLLWASGLSPAAGATVDFYRGQTLLARATTDAQGFARVRWTPPAAGDYRFTARIVAVPAGASEDLLRVAPAPLLVAARPKDAPLAVIDLDHTVVDDSFFRAMVGNARPMADSVEVTRRIARAYTIVYLTHRPDVLTRRSKHWLEANGYPPGPLLVADMGDVLDSGKFKTARLSALRRSFPRVAAGIGDKVSDAQAYVDNGLTAYLLPYCKAKPKDLRRLAAQLRSLRDRGRLNVVSDWRQIEAGLFGGRTFPPAAYADRLEREAARLEAERRREKDDD